MRQRPRIGLIAGALTAALAAGPATGGPKARLVSRFVWTSKAELHGGYSGLELAPDGVHFFALSDRTQLVEGRLLRDGDGAITGVEAAPPRGLLGIEGQPFPSLLGDSEGLALAADGTLFVSFEAVSRVWRYDSPGGHALAEPTHPDFATMIRNGGLEALAIAPDGALYTLPERSGLLTRPFPVYARRAGQWEHIGDIARNDEFLPVGADFGPDGRFYLLERQFTGLRGFASRVRAFDMTKDGPGVGETILETAPGQRDNLEGLAVWRDGAGAIRLTMISDDNFSFFQTTEIVEYVLPQ